MRVCLTYVTVKLAFNVLVPWFVLLVGTQVAAIICCHRLEITSFTIYLSNYGFDCM